MAHLHSNQFTNVDTIWNGCVYYFTVSRCLFFFFSFRLYNYEIVSLCYTSFSQFHFFMHPVPVCRVISPSLPLLLFIFNFCFLPCHTWSRIVQQQIRKIIFPGFAWHSLQDWKFSPFPFLFGSLSRLLVSSSYSLCVSFHFVSFQLFVLFCYLLSLFAWRSVFGSFSVCSVNGWQTILKIWLTGTVRCWWQQRDTHSIQYICIEMIEWIRHVKNCPSRCVEHIEHNNKQLSFMPTNWILNGVRTMDSIDFGLLVDFFSVQFNSRMQCCFHSLEIDKSRQIQLIKYSGCRVCSGRLRLTNHNNVYHERLSFYWRFSVYRW